MAKLLPLPLLLLMMTAGIAGAQPSAPATDKWEFFVSPFLWGAGIDGTVGFAAREVDFEVSAQDLMKSLDFGIMGNLLARKNRWAIGFDAVYTDLSKDVAVANANVAARNPRLDMSMTILSGDIGYEVAPSLDVLGGIRSVSSSAGVELDSGPLGKVDGGFVDPFVGARIHRNLSEKFSINLRGDVGGFGVGSDFSWFLTASGGFRVSKLISLDFGYRIWDFDYESDDDFRKLDATLAGFGGGLTFHF